MGTSQANDIKAKASNSESGSLTKETVGKVIQKNAKAAPQGRLNPRETGDYSSPRQEPGRNLASVATVGAQTHFETTPPATGVTQAPVLAFEQGVRLTPVVTPAMFCGITVIMPAAVVAMLRTYLLAAEVLSQPH